MRRALAITVLGLLFASPASAGEHPVLMYLPNRIFDVFDIVRARVRVGPGIAVGARVTKLTDVFVGSYVSLWAGMPGPRGKPRLPLPVGYETRSGVGVSVAQATTGNPDYGPAEVGAGFQALIFGLDFGIAPYDLLDLVAGFVFLDPRDDDF